MLVKSTGSLSLYVSMRAALQKCCDVTEAVTLSDRDRGRVRQKGGVPGPPTRNPPPRIHRRPSGLPTALQEH
jgi:hypothetical protein